MKGNHQGALSRSNNRFSNGHSLKTARSPAKSISTGCKPLNKRLLFYFYIFILSLLFKGNEEIIFIIHKHTYVFCRCTESIVGCNAQKHRLLIAQMRLNRHSNRGVGYSVCKFSKSVSGAGFYNKNVQKSFRADRFSPCDCCDW
mgnify:CR=1 FL=1